MSQDSSLSGFTRALGTLQSYHSDGIVHSQGDTLMACAASFIAEAMRTARPQNDVQLAKSHQGYTVTCDIGERRTLLLELRMSLVTKAPESPK